MELNQLLPALIALIGAQPADLSKRVLVAHEDQKLLDLEHLSERPARIRQHFAAAGIDAFTGYVNRFKDPNSTIFITPTLTSLANGAVLATAVLDYHESSAQPAEGGALPHEPRWGQHTASLAARPSLPYAKLLALDGKFMDQPQFAQALEDIARFASSHSQADLVETARTISLTSKGDFKSFEDELSGSVDFKFDVRVGATAGTAERKLTVPSTIDFTIPLIDGLDPVVITTKFKYRVPESPGAKVTLGIQIVDRVWLEDAAIAEAKGKLADATKLPVYVGESAARSQ